MIDLIRLKKGKVAKVVEIEGGSSCQQRLNNLGIRQGVLISKISASETRGPIIVKAGHTQIALGRGMASKIIVEEPS
ncbi:MAG: ferrous iron transport protein A [Candidatus Omnitrophica bacterium]|nr:ferrous iron transport protein A [Candidatus Omnitrophota bacterium]MBD3268920.1 ferrous iron transport protein A [Candidatus Omnitrophota bacterium]